MKKRDEILVGVVMALAFALLVVGTLWLVRGGLQTGYPLYARFPWGSGIKQGQSVLLTGVNVGFVGDVNLKENGTLIVTMRINKEYRVPQGTIATIEANGIFGDVVVALRPVKPNAESIPEGGFVPIGKASPSIADLLAKVDTASGQLTDVAHTVQVELVQGGGIADLHKTLSSANRLVGELSAIAAEQSRQLTVTMRSLNRAVSAVDSAAVDSTVRNLKTTSANIEELTSNLERTSGRLNGLLAKVDSGQGTAGKFLNDPSVYNELHATLARMDSLAADLRQNPKRYINVHIF
jgi:phospholipid/cholesterol/gamma-HCH transport system substrate-binding protein